PILCPSSSFYDAPATAVIDALSLHDALPISPTGGLLSRCRCTTAVSRTIRCWWGSNDQRHKADYRADHAADHGADQFGDAAAPADRKSTRLNSSHVKISYAVFCLKKKTKTKA